MDAHETSQDEANESVVKSRMAAFLSVPKAEVDALEADRLKRRSPKPQTSKPKKGAA